MTEIHVVRYPGDDFETVTVRLSVQTMQAVQAALAEVSDYSENFVLNEFFDSAEAMGFGGSQFTCAIEDNPNYDHEDPDEGTYATIPVLRDA